MIDVSIPFGDADRARLGQALGPRDDLDTIARLLAKTGAEELLTLATGVAVFQNMSDLRSYRIFAMMKQGLPRRDTEILVASIFKLPIGSARRLVNAAVARYAVQLGGIDEIIRQVLKAAQPSDEPPGWLVDLSSELVRERLTAMLSSRNLPNPERIKRGASWRYPIETYAALRDSFGLPQRNPGAPEPPAVVPAQGPAAVPSPQARHPTSAKVKRRAWQRKATPQLR